MALDISPPSFFDMNRRNLTLAAIFVILALALITHSLGFEGGNSRQVMGRQIPATVVMTVAISVISWFYLSQDNHLDVKHIAAIVVAACMFTVSMYLINHKLAESVGAKAGIPIAIVMAGIWTAALRVVSGMDLGPSPSWETSRFFNR